MINPYYDCTGPYKKERPAMKQGVSPNATPNTILDSIGDSITQQALQTINRSFQICAKSGLNLIMSDV